MLIKYKRNYSGNYKIEEGTLLKVLPTAYGGFNFEILTKEGKKTTIFSEIIKESLPKQLLYLLFGKYFNELYEETYNGIYTRLDFINKYIGLKTKILTLF